MAREGGAACWLLAIGRRINWLLLFSYRGHRRVRNQPIQLNWYLLAVGLTSGQVCFSWIGVGRGCSQLDCSWLFRTNGYLRSSRPNTNPTYHYHEGRTIPSLLHDRILCAIPIVCRSRRVRKGETIFPALLNDLSVSADIVGIDSKSEAIRERFGYSISCSCH